MPKFTITHYGLQPDGVTKETEVEAETEMLACALALTEFRQAGATIDDHDPVDASEGGAAPSSNHVSDVAMRPMRPERRPARQGRRVERVEARQLNPGADGLARLVTCLLVERSSAVYLH